MLHIMPSWNLKGHEGEKVEVCLYTNLKEVELEVNGVKYEKEEFLRLNRLFIKNIQMA